MTVHNFLIARIVVGLAALLGTLLGSTPSMHAEPLSKNWQLQTRLRKETEADSNRYHTLVESVEIDPQRTAVVVCDMWDLHHCLNSTKRVGELAPRMNQFLNQVRSQGATIIHAPSSCVDFYKDHPARRHAVETPRSKKLPKDIGSWCNNIPSESEGVYPIDQSDGGEDDFAQEHQAWAEKLSEMGRNPKAPWKRQIDIIAIEDQDFISDNGAEIWSILENHSIENVVLVGVHTNMCVLGRPFGLRQMVKNGKRTFLVRDLTDTMYNPKMAPYVSHFTGTDLIIEHIEKYICPTITSDQILGGKAFRFKNDHRPRLMIVTAEREYETERTLPEFALKHLGKNFSVDFVFANSLERNDLPGIERLESADIVLISVRRRALPAEQLKVIRDFVSAGKPVIGIRTASHAFSLRNDTAANREQWPRFDADVFGGNYTNHHGDGPDVTLSVVPSQANHPILEGVDVASTSGKGSLYKVSPLGETATPLISGAIPGVPAEPIAWINEPKTGGLVFYTSLGAPEDFKSPGFNRLLKNAIHWAAKTTAFDVVPSGR